MSEDKAITTGAPVATNDAQAAELAKPARRFAVKVKHHDIDAWLVDIGGKRIEYDNWADAELDRETEQAGNPGYSYTVVDITPTPRPTPGGEWYFEWNSTLGEWIVNGPQPTNGLILCHDEDDAKWLRGRLNAADAMEQALRKCMAAIAPLPATNELLEAFQSAKAALRGGA